MGRPVCVCAIECGNQLAFLSPVLLDSGLVFYKNAQVLSMAQVLGEKRYYSECFLCAGPRASTLIFSSGKEP